MRKEECEKEIEYKQGNIFGTSEYVMIKCGWNWDGEKRYCDKCKKNGK